MVVIVIKRRLRLRGQNLLIIVIGEVLIWKIISNVRFWIILLRRLYRKSRRRRVGKMEGCWGRSRKRRGGIRGRMLRMLLRSIWLVMLYRLGRERKVKYREPAHN